MHPEADPTPFLRHVQACNNAVLPGQRVPFRIAGEQVGWVLPDLATALGGFDPIAADPDGGLSLREPQALPQIARSLAGRGLARWRGETFDVRARPDGPVLAQIDRGSLPKFGIVSVGVHVNGLVESPAEASSDPYIWIAYRSPSKALDPGKLDQIVAGGIPTGLSAEETLVKEAAEEADIPPALIRQVVPVATIAYAMDRAEGLRRDRLHCYDLSLPGDFRPRPNDDEVERFELWPLSKIFATVRDTDKVKFNVNLVLIDLFIRRGMFAPDAAAVLRAALDDAARGQ